MVSCYHARSQRSHQKIPMKKPSTLFFGLFLVSTLMLSGCVGTIVGTTVDVAIEAAKVPFKVGAAVVDVATGDDEDEKKD